MGCICVGYSCTVTGLLAKHKRDRVSSTTAEHSSLSSPESATPLNDASADPHRGAREEEGRKGSVCSCTASCPDRESHILYVQVD